MAKITNVICTNNKEIDIQSLGGNINIGTKSISTAINIGNNTGSSSMTLNVGSGGIIVPSFSTYGAVGVSSSGKLLDGNASTSGFVLTSNGAAPVTFQITPNGTIGTIDGDSGFVNGTTIILSGGTTGLTTTATSATVDLTGTLVVSNGGTGLANLTSGSLLVGNGTSTVNFISYSSSYAATSDVVSRDSSGNSWMNNLSQGEVNNSASGTITLTAASSKYQVVSGGSGTATIVLPDATTLSNGWLVEISNNASGDLTIQDDSLATLFTMPTGSYVRIILLSNSVLAGTWDYHWLLPEVAQYGTSGLTIGGTLTSSGKITATFGGLTATAGGLTVTAGTITASPFTTTGALVCNTSGVITDANASTSGYVLTSQGSSSVPIFAALPASIITINGNTGSMTGSTVTISGGTTGLTTSATSATMTISGTLVVANGGTGVTSVTVTPTATSFAGWDANSNLRANNFIPSLTNTSVSGTITLTAASSYVQLCSVNTTTTYILPVVSTLKLGQSFLFFATAGVITTINIKSSGSNQIVSATFPNIPLLLTCISLTGTGVASWAVSSQMYQDAANNIFSFSGCGRNLTTGANNIVMGTQGTSTEVTSGSGNICLGTSVGNTLTTGSNNICIGNGAGLGINSAVSNTISLGHNVNETCAASNSIAIGFQAGLSISCINPYIAIGYISLSSSTTTGGYNVGFGVNTGSSFTGAEQSNICIGAGATGTTGQSNALLIGNGTGSAAGNINKARISGIYGISLSATTSNVVMVGSGSNVNYLSTQASTINFATAASQSIITIGNNTSASSVTITAGSGKVTINSPTATKLSSSIVTAPVSSATATTAFGTSLTAGTSVQNTTGYDLMVNICFSVTSSTAATITLGVGSATAPTANTVVSSFTTAGKIINFMAVVPNNYYLVVNTTGTIVVGSITTQVCPM